MDESRSPRLTDIGYVKSLMARHGLRFEKRYGQNFLINHAVPMRIAEGCGAPRESGILEIGPGIGTLTAELARRYTKVAAVEIDRGLLPVLGETLADYKNTAVIGADFLQLDLAALIDEYFRGMEVAVCANLPYYITTPVILKLLDSGVRFGSITLLVQREFAARLCAEPGAPEYSALTAEAARYYTVRRLFTVSAGSFIPAPKIESTVVRLEPRKSPLGIVSREVYKKVVAAAFEQRRKTLCNALSAGRDKTEVARLLREAGVEPDRRGETLSAAEFAAVALALEGV